MRACEPQCMNGDIPMAAQKRKRSSLTKAHAKARAHVPATKARRPKAKKNVASRRGGASRSAGLIKRAVSAMTR
jgi:hypothetical protein